MKKEYVPKIGDMVEIIVYDGIELTGTVVSVEDWGTSESHIEVKAFDDKGIYYPWYSDNSCVRLLTELERALR